MRNNIENFDILLSLLKQNGIRHFVLSPGGTNQKLVWRIQADPFFHCYSVVDERSAIYFAIGLYLQTGEPIATSCTSAQATRNYIPGLTEAFYKHAPILAITMSKHPRFTYQEYMQAPDQTSLPKDAVKASYMMAYLQDDNDYLHSMRVANEAILELTHGSKGPVQLDIPWLDFTLDTEVKNIRQIKRYSVDDKWATVIDNKRILLVIGEHRPFADELKMAIERFCESYDVAVYTNHLSNYNGKYVIEANLQMTTLDDRAFAETYRPDIIITIGGQTGDYPLYHKLRKISLADVEHWRVSLDGNVVDTYDKLTCIFEFSEEFFFNQFDTNKKNDHQYFCIWKQLLDSAKRNVDIPFSNTYAAQHLSKSIPNNSYIQFSILNSLRNWNLFPINPTVKCFSIVGAFGIDGGMSTLIGISMTTDELCFMVIGDLAFLYDINSLSIRGIRNNARILLVNNNGGVEFKMWGEDKAIQDKYVAASGSFKNAKGWAETCGFHYLSAQNKEEFKANEKSFVSKSEKPILFELFVSDKDEYLAYRSLLEENREYSDIDKMKKNLKKGIKSLLGK